MASTYKRKLLGLILPVIFILKLLDAACDIPVHFRGDFFSIETGKDVNTLINQQYMKTESFDGECKEIRNFNTTDVENRHDSNILLYTRTSDCYRCYIMYYRTPNIIQYKYSTCVSKVSEMADLCGEIRESTDNYTMFRKEYETVNCKNTFEGVFNFTYEWREGGGSICASPNSIITACQEPGSVYVDNQVFTMAFGKCPDVSTSENKEIRFLCMGTWEVGTGNVWSAVADISQDVYRVRFRCMLTRYDQEYGDNKKRYTMSWWADCSKLKTEYDGPLRLELLPVVGGFQLQYTKPTCNFPTNYSGHWFHRGEFDVDVDINSTHIYFKTKLDEYSYKETYFACNMNSATRYMTTAVTVGKCEIDHVCFDMMPRHHSIIRWRMAKPYRLTEIERAYPDFENYMFRQTCTWSSFTINRDDVAWNYKTFLLNPPVPIPCPIRGRYRFKQTGPASELITTRIRGITERPRHQIGCDQYVTEWKSCDLNPTKLLLDAEYCESVDHTGRPIGEYDMPDWELSCVGYWEEDWRPYMVTWDPEDPTSAFRCWAYERTDWRYVVASRSTGASCIAEQSPWSNDPKEGASLRFELEESERLYDDCAQNYQSGDPFVQDKSFFRDGLATAPSLQPVSHATVIFISIIALAAATL